MVVKDKGDKQGAGNRSKWITDFEILPDINKILIGTGYDINVHREIKYSKSFKLI